MDTAVLSSEDVTPIPATGAQGGVARTTRSAGLWGPALGEENRKGKGIGIKRDLDEQQEDEEAVAQWGHTGGEEDGGVGGELAKMEVDEGVGSPSKGGDGGRTAKRAAGKKGL